ncbi:MAG: ribosome biogenesis GTPase Der [Clostridiaceae bacterium]|nr:ribosome biogenesis GTPase Der [Clostridiaceae bacterium]
MLKPLVAVVGKPNVGKSTFFNRICGKRVSIVQNTPGVTRDRLYADAEWCGREFTLVDTGGLELKNEDEMWRHIRAQAEAAVDSADVIVFLTDAKTGVSLDDDLVAAYLRKTDKPVLLAVNKVDNNERHLVYDFYSLGLGEPFGISAEQGKGLTELLDAIIENFPKEKNASAEYASDNEFADKTASDGETAGDASDGESTPDAVIRIAVVGKPNAGKSSLVNKILGYDRSIVSGIAGTTRDAVDTDFTANGRRYTIVDTAGMRKKRAVEEELESLSVMRSLASIRRADVVLVIVDAKEGLTEQDVKIAGYAHEQGKPSVIVMNKWDVVEKDAYTADKIKAALAEDLKFMDYMQTCFISALTGRRANAVLPLVDKVYENSKRRIKTGLLNDVLGDAVRVNEPPAHKGRRLKIYFMSEVAVAPPSFAVFVNDPELMHFSYERYLENSIRKSFDFSGTPIKIFIRAKKGNTQLF